MAKDFLLNFFFFPPLWFLRLRGPWPEEVGWFAGLADPGSGKPDGCCVVDMSIEQIHNGWDYRLRFWRRGIEGVGQPGVDEAGGCKTKGRYIVGQASTLEAGMCKLQSNVDSGDVSLSLKVR